MNDRKDVGLLTLDDSALIPTEIGRKEVFPGDGELELEGFEIGAEVQEARRSGQMPYENYYRHFKADLALPKSVLGSPEGQTWEMKTWHTDRDKGHDRMGEIIKQVGDEYHYFTPKHAAHVYLYHLCLEAVQSAQEITDSDDIKVHLTAPAYEGKDKDRSQRYRNNIREVIEQFEQDTPFSGVDFVVDRDDFVYEPYGVYYYYAFIEEKISDEEGGNTYLIYDMGGSTTDVGIVQINRKGDVTTAYPICKSIDCAGAYLDRYILKYLRDDGRLKQVSAKWNPEFEKVEKAKIDLCEKRMDEVELNIKGDTFVLTRERIASALRELWNDDNRPLAQGFRGFLEDVQTHARQNSLFLEFENIEKVFLAGGSIGLPGLRDLIIDTLRSSRFDLVKDQTEKKDLFQAPELASSSSLAALGRAAELANQEAPLVLSRAQHLFAKISDEDGDNLVFRPKSIRKASEISPDEDETYLFDIQELQDRIDENGSWEDFDDEEYQNYNPDEDQSFPRDINISFRTDISEYNSSPHFSEAVKEEILDEAPGKKFLRFKFSCQAQYDEDSVRVKPFVYVDYKGAESRRRLYREQGSERVSLKPGKVDGRVHVCIDLGMNNTCVSICTPGRQLPEEMDALKIPVSDHSTNVQTSNGETEARDDISGDGAPSPHDHAPETGEETGSTSATLKLSDGTVEKIESLINSLEGKNGDSSTKERDKPVEALSSIMNETTKRLDEIVSEVKQMREEDESESSTHPAEPVLEAVSENKHSFGIPKTTTDDFESFVHFVRDHKEGLYYPDSVLRTVWMHTQSENSRLAILAGPPGSGKTSLVRLIAEFFNRDLGEDWQHYHLLQPVSPTWLSPSSLLGSYSEIDGEYHSTDFLRFLMTAEKHHQWVEDDKNPRLFFACLDEFNIAQPEQYMADLLSKMEAKRGTKSRTLTLCRKDKMGWNEDLSVEIAPNLRLFATINTDASTKTLSPKVLDRSVFIRLTPSYEDLKQVAERLSNRYEVENLNEALFEGSEEERDQDEPEPPSLLGDLMMIGRYAETPFGYRVLEQAYEQASNHPRMGRDLDEVVDDIICNFFLPKLPGSHAVSNPMEYVDALTADKAERLREYPKASRILDSIQNGLPGQAAV